MVISKKQVFQRNSQAPTEHETKLRSMILNVTDRSFQKYVGIR